MPRKGEEVAIHVLHIYLEMRYALRAIYQYRHAMKVCTAHNLFYGVHRSQNIAYLHHAYQAGTRRKQFIHFIENKLTSIVNGYHPNGYTATCSLQLPWYNVAMVFHCGNNHLVARLHKSLAKRRGNEVNTLGGSARKYDFVIASGINEFTNGVSGSLVKVGCLLRKIVNATMHVSIGVKILVLHGIENAKGLLRCRPIIEVNQGLTIYFAR